MRPFVVCFWSQNQHYWFDGRNFAGEGQFDLKMRFQNSYCCHKNQRYEHAKHLKTNLLMIRGRIYFFYINFHAIFKNNTMMAQSRNFIKMIFMRLRVD